MKIHWNLVQGTEEWESVRYGKVGGSLSKGLFVKSDTLFIQLLSEMTENYQPDYDTFETAAMVRGHELEPQARRELSEYTCVEFLEAGYFECEENPLLGISPDGISEDLTIGCELKCLGAKKHTEVMLTKGIHLDYLHQCIHYFTVNPDLLKLYFAAYRPEHKYKPLVVREITLESFVNIGTTSKPVMVTVRIAVEMAKESAKELHKDLIDAIENMKF